MTILDAVTYRSITSDTVTYSAGVLEAALSAGQRKVEDFLRRPVESAERTETLRTSVRRRTDEDWGRYIDPVFERPLGEVVVHPSATPVTAVPAGYTIRTTATVAVGSDWSGNLTYTGGWTLSTAPYVILEALAWSSYHILARSGASGSGELVDPEGNVIPVVPPFSNTPAVLITRELCRYIRRSGTS